MHIRPTRREDILEIDEIYRKCHEDKFSLPDLSNSVTHAVIVNKDAIIGFGVVKVYAEAVMILDLDQSKVDRLQAMEKLMQEAVRGCVEAGINQLHVSVKDSKLQRLLERHYEFRVVQGTVLFREI